MIIEHNNENNQSILDIMKLHVIKEGNRARARLCEREKNRKYF